MTSEFTTSTRTHTMTLYGIREEQPGSRWQALHDVTRDALPPLVPQRGSGGQARSRYVSQDAREPHARARPCVGAPRGACRG